MHKIITIIGLVFLLIGGGMFAGGFFGAETYAGARATEENLANVSMYNAMCSAGLLIGIIGFIIFLYGLQQKDKDYFQQQYQQPYPQQQYQQPQNKNCPNCNLQVAIGTQFCPSCGTKMIA